MSETYENKIAKLLASADYRTAYIRAKLDVLIPSQIRALRSGQTQAELAKASGMLQSRISAIETPGKVNFNLETLVRLAATFKVGMVVRFVPFSEMLQWENSYSQDNFRVRPLEDDSEFLNPSSSTMQNSLSIGITGATTAANLPSLEQGQQIGSSMASEVSPVRGFKPRSQSEAFGGQRHVG